MRAKEVQGITLDVVSLADRVDRGVMHVGPSNNRCCEGTGTMGVENTVEMGVEALFSVT